ncbi:hypothetical protein F5J12DRAFT_781903 [Pisolithus orientalis]|uniref:uncharacterized protein n=1 Tax=Pisolithus orientalis TaxID=936130 RepID=UPI002224627D|nr:uncharacterized protein F5J12DRAFT_781903 [Pisolithus orientalis]KAI6010941.1 hypothetical protein F5J12DRAFT_781903 [Pisolithus orientalis]
MARYLWLRVEDLSWHVVEILLRPEGVESTPRSVIHTSSKGEVDFLHGLLRAKSLGLSVRKTSMSAAQIMFVFRAGACHALMEISIAKGFRNMQWRLTLKSSCVVPYHWLIDHSVWSHDLMGRNPRTSEDLKGTQSSEDKRATGCSIPACTRSSQWHTRETSVHLETGNVIDPVPVVVLRVGVLPPRFIVEEVENEPETYFIKVQEDMSPVIKNTRGVPGPEEPNLPVPRVFAFENEDPEKWVILHREDPEIYT